jgi:hypothetical protein
MLPLLILALFILYGIPSLAVIFFIRWLLIRYSTKKRANIFAITSICLLLLAGVSVVIWDRMERTFYMSSDFCGEIMIELRVFEIHSFQDAPNEYQLTVKDVQGNILAEEVFVMDGSYIQITPVKKEKQTLEISGYSDYHINANQSIVLEGVSIDCGDTLRVTDQYEFEKITSNQN